MGWHGARHFPSATWLQVNSSGALCGTTLEGPRAVDTATLAAGLEAASIVAPPAIRQLNMFVAQQAAKAAG
jgi:hypothetical protein